MGAFFVSVTGSDKFGAGPNKKGWQMPALCRFPNSENLVFERQDTCLCECRFREFRPCDRLGTEGDKAFEDFL